MRRTFPPSDINFNSLALVTHCSARLSPLVMRTERRHLSWQWTGTIYQRCQKVSKQNLKVVLRWEFQAWLSNDWNDLDILWLQHDKAWDDKEEQC